MAKKKASYARGKLKAAIKEIKAAFNLAECKESAMQDALEEANISRERADTFKIALETIAGEIGSLQNARATAETALEYDKDF
jgi:hypothetical protein